MSTGELPVDEPEQDGGGEQEVKDAGGIGHGSSAGAGRGKLGRKGRHSSGKTVIGIKLMRSIIILLCALISYKCAKTGLQMRKPVVVRGDGGRRVYV